MVDFIIDNAGELLLSVVFVLCKIFGRKKSAEKIEQALQRKKQTLQRKKQKRVSKLEKKSAKATAKANKCLNNLLHEVEIGEQLKGG